jgi:hypothetical protein
MNRRVMHAVAAAWMLCMAGSAAAQCQAGMPTIPGAGCVPREVIENSNRGGGAQPPQYAPGPPPAPRRDINFTPVVPVIEYGAHVLAADNKSLFGGTGYLSARDAQEGVLGFCQERTGTDCRSLGFFKDTCQGFAFDRQNRPYKGVDTDPRKAVRQAMAACVRESGKGQCQLQKLPICAGNDYVGSDFNASKEWGPGEYDAQVRSWTATAERGLR